MKRLPRQYSREKRKEQIINQFRVWHTKQDTEPKKMTRIAKALGMIPSYEITLMLQELVSEGKLTCEERDQSGRWTTKFYLLTETPLITEKFFRRTITVRGRSVPDGQMALQI